MEFSCLLPTGGRSVVASVAEDCSKCMFVNNNSHVIVDSSLSSSGNSYHTFAKHVFIPTLRHCDEMLRCYKSSYTQYSIVVDGLLSRNNNHFIAKPLLAGPPQCEGQL